MSMDDVPPFSGEWGYGDQNHKDPNNPAASELTDLTAETVASESPVSSASRLTSYGLDTASRIYGLGPVLEAIMETDITSTENVSNPLGAVYRNLIPKPEERINLFREIRRENVQGNQYNTDSGLNSDDSSLGLTRSGDFYDRTPADVTAEQVSVDAIRAMRRLLEILDNDPRFAELREQAATEGKNIIELLTSDQSNPTLTQLINRIGDELSEENIEEFVEEIAKETETQEDIVGPERDTNQPNPESSDTLTW